MTRKQKLEQTKKFADLWYQQQRNQIYIMQQKERRGIQLFEAVGKDSLNIYVVEDTKAQVFQRLKEKYPYTAFDKGLYPEALFIRETKK